MKYQDTIAATCRYGDCLGEILKDADIVWEDSLADYQGSVDILASMPDGTFVHYEYSYGSCSGCDDWEARSLSDSQIVEEMRRGLAVLTAKPDNVNVEKYVNNHLSRAKDSFDEWKKK